MYRNANLINDYFRNEKWWVGLLWQVCRTLLSFFYSILYHRSISIFFVTNCL